MGYNDNNPYYSPEKCGLTLLDSVDIDSDNYGFNMFVVWHDEEGTLYWGNDSGCSCPAPFEDIPKEHLDKGTARECIRSLNSWQQGNEWAMKYDRAQKRQDIMDLAATVRDFNRKFTR